MKIKVKTVCSAFAFIAWCGLLMRWNTLIKSGECSPMTECDLGWVIVASLVGLYLGLELLVAPESAALYLLTNLVFRGRFKLSPVEARLGGVIFLIATLFILYSAVAQLVGFRP